MSVRRSSEAPGGSRRRPRRGISLAPFSARYAGACRAIVRSSEPWKTLDEGIDFDRLPMLSRAVVCLVNDEVAGFVIYTPEPVFARGGYLRAMAVAAPFRRSGVGTLLLAYAEKETSRASGHFYLCVSSFNRKAQAFYRSLGYRKAGAVPGLIRPGASELIYWKRLS